jgi:hypothetical protein
MIRSLTQQVVRVVMFATLTVAVAEAQSGAGSDFTGPGGGGGGTGGAVAPLGVPMGAPSGPLSSIGSSALGGAVTLFAGAGAGGLSVSNPAGGTVTVPATTARAIASVLSGGGATAVQNLQNILVGEGVPAGAAGALANALGTLGSNPSRANLVAAIEAFNAAIDASSGTPSSAMLAIRFAIASASR